MAKHKFPQSTTGRYLPGVGTTFTRANIRLLNQSRAEQGQPQASQDEVIAAFIPRHHHTNKEREHSLRIKFRAALLT